VVRRFQSGDSAAGQELYDRYADFLISYIAKRMSRTLMRDADPEDVVQSVFGSAFRVLGEGKYPTLASGELKKILVGVARKKLANRARKVKRRDNLARQVQSPHEPVDPRPTPDEAAEVYDGLKKCLDEEKAVGRAIIRMTLGEGKSDTAAAAELGISQWTSRKVRSEFTRRLEEQLLGSR
jgi:RNA polymerase sigma factor (sigma-70 family)